MTAWTHLGARDRRALLLGACVLVPALGARVVVRPYVRARIALHQRTQEQRDLLARELTLIAAAHQLPATIAEAARAFDARRSSLFPGHDPLAAAGALVNLTGDAARRHGVLLEAVESGASVSLGPGLVAVQIEVRGRSDLQGLLGWLRALETAPRLIRIERLAVRRLEAGAPGGVETLSIGAAIRGYLVVAAERSRPDVVVAPSGASP